MSHPPLLSIIANVVGADDDEVTEASSMETLDKWDSLRQVLLMTELERQFGIRFQYKEMTEAVSVASIRALLTGRGISAA